MNDFGAKVAKCLTHTQSRNFKVEPLTENSFDHGVVILQEGGDPQFGIYIRHNDRDHKFIVYPHWAKTTDGTELPYSSQRPDLTIKMTDKKTASVVANDINKRFLPGYIEHFEKAAKLRDQHDSYRNEKNGMAAGFAAMLNGGRQKENSFSNYTQKGAYVDHGECHTDDVELKLRGLTADQTREILNLINEGPQEYKVTLQIKGTPYTRELRAIATSHDEAEKQVLNECDYEDDILWYDSSASDDTPRRERFKQWGEINIKTVEVAHKDKQS